MPQPTRRAFTLFDAMVLIAATAFGMGGLRMATGSLAEFAAQFRESLAATGQPEAGWSSWGWTAYQVYGLAALSTVPFAYAWTMALMVLWFRAPRPHLRRLGRLPGWNACLAATVVVLPSLIVLAGLVVVRWFGVLFIPNALPMTEAFWELKQGLAFLLIPGLTGTAVLGAWVTPLLGGRWRAEPTWIDRFGRCLGVYWITVIILPIWGLG
ncbi:MAG: hypothetical protein ACYC61_02475 [Isosphaeraceae bacterium]